MGSSSSYRSGLGGAEDDEGLEALGLAKTFTLKLGGEGIAMAEISRRAGISQTTWFASRAFFNWKKKYERPQPAEMFRLQPTEDENAQPT